MVSIIQLTENFRTSLGQAISVVEFFPSPFKGTISQFTCPYSNRWGDRCFNTSSHDKMTLEQLYTQLAQRVIPPTYHVQCSLPPRPHALFLTLSLSLSLSLPPLLFLFLSLPPLLFLFLSLSIPLPLFVHLSLSLSLYLSLSLIT